MFKSVANTAIHDSGLLRHGIEICTFSSKRIYITKTVAVQDFKMYGFRDYERPARDRRSGMLPPKLAQMMINLSGAQPGQIVWDPFCGSGTILMESLLMGISAIGSDISEKAISDSRENLKWLEHHFKIQNQWKVFVEDARKGGSTKADAIVTETFLGPPLFKFPGKERCAEVFEEVSEIVFGFLEKVESGIPIVLAIPFIKGQREHFHIEEFTLYYLR